MSEVVFHSIENQLLDTIEEEIVDYLFHSRSDMFDSRPPDLCKDIRLEVQGFINEGKKSSDHHLFRIIDSDRNISVGIIWYRMQSASTGMGEAFLMWLRIDKDRRGRGYASSTINGV